MSAVEICNTALRFCGQPRISSLTESNKAARLCNDAYLPALRKELRRHVWNFSIVRASIAADATAPVHGRAYAYTLPSDPQCLLLLPPDPEDERWNRDWKVEGRKIVTDDSSPLEIRYVSLVEDTAVMDDLFKDALAARLALELMEPLTQSNSKKGFILQIYRDAIREAKLSNAFEEVPAPMPADEWVEARTL